jgi:ABC-2 type transport system permease protein
MSTATPIAHTALAATTHAPFAFGRLLTSEWTKIRSVRSTIWALLLLVVLTLGFTTLITG